jgi:hypothetical protein
MIKVVRTGEETSQKIIGVFLKRVKKSNLIARKRKTQIMAPHMSYFKRHSKAIKREKFLADRIIAEKVGKK